MTDALAAAAARSAETASSAAPLSLTERWMLLQQARREAPSANREERRAELLIRHRWSRAAPQFREDLARLRRCAATTCSAREMRALRFSARLAHMPMALRLRAAMRFIQREIRPVRDTWGDAWRGPAGVLNAGVGDCEDVALATAALLALSGVELDRLQLVVSRVEPAAPGRARRGKRHAALVVLINGAPIVLDPLARTRPMRARFREGDVRLPLGGPA